MQQLVATVAVPTLHADGKLVECVRALERQTFRAFELVIVDNSGRGLVLTGEAGRRAQRVIENGRNMGFAAAVNAAFRSSSAPYFVTLNDDAVPHPGWLAALIGAIERRPDVGMCASQIRLFGESQLDSAGMLLCADASSKQRGHFRPVEDFPVEEEVLFPSACAALYRRDMLDEVGLFDEEFFLYCEDTDLGLRARRRGWRCLYVPDAVVEHHYSHSAGSASPMKAYYVERNRLMVLFKNFPPRMAAAAPFAALARYLWHALFMLDGRGAAARFRSEGHAGARMLYYVLKAHLALAPRLARLCRERRRIQAEARLSTRVYTRLLRAHSISPRRVAEL